MPGVSCKERGLLQREAGVYVESHCTRDLHFVLQAEQRSLIMGCPSLGLKV